MTTNDHAILAACSVAIGDAMRAGEIKASTAMRAQNALNDVLEEVKPVGGQRQVRGGYVMNTAQVQHRANELQAAISERLQHETDEELFELLDMHLRKPKAVQRAAVEVNTGTLATFAAIPIYQEILRRKEAALMLEQMS